MKIGTSLICDIVGCPNRSFLPSRVSDPHSFKRIWIQLFKLFWIRVKIPRLNFLR